MDDENNPNSKAYKDAHHSPVDPRFLKISEMDLNDTRHIYNDVLRQKARDRNNFVFTNSTTSRPNTPEEDALLARYRASKAKKAGVVSKEEMIRNAPDSDWGDYRHDSVELVNTAMTLIESGNIDAAQILLNQVLDD